MNQNIQFIPQNNFSSNGYLMVPDHHGEMIPCKLQRTWTWSQLTGPLQTSIILTAGNKNISIRYEDLLNKLRLNKEEIDVIVAETDLVARSVLFKNMVMIKNTIEKQARGKHFLELFILDTYKKLRKNNPEMFIQQLQEILHSGPIFFSYVTGAFETLVEEYSQIHNDNFFILSEKLLEIIVSTEDIKSLKIWLGEIIVTLEDLASKNPQHADMLKPLMRKIRSTQYGLTVDDESSFL